MYIVLLKAMPNGAAGKVHTLDELSITPTTVTATVTSKPELDGRVCWQDRVEVPLSALAAGDPISAATAFLTGSDGYLAGGIAMDDPTSLETLRGDMLARVAAKRDELLVGGCVTAFGPIDTDMVSRQNISGAVSMASIAKASGVDFALKWRMRDNSYVELSADEMIAVGVTVGWFVSAVYDKSFALKDAILAAVTEEDLEAIDLTGEVWPS